jgi:hypothetical protein
MSQLFSNNASALTAADFEIVDTSLSLTGGFGALFPNPVAPDFAKITIEDTSGNVEILKLTARATDVLTVVRAQENTSALQFLSGSRVECRNTAQTFDEFIQRTGGVMSGELDLNGQVLRDALITDGEIRNAPLRGSDGGTSNQIIVPTAGGTPTLGGNQIWHQGNDGDGSSLDADLLDGEEGAFYLAYAEDANNLNTGTVDNARLTADVALDNQKNGWTAGEYTVESNITATATTVVDADVSNAFDIFMDVNITTFTLDNIDDGQQIVLLFRQSAGGETCAFPGAWKWPNGAVPILSTGSSDQDILALSSFNGVVYANLIKAFA